MALKYAKFSRQLSLLARVPGSMPTNPSGPGFLTFGAGAGLVRYRVPKYPKQTGGNMKYLKWVGWVLLVLLAFFTATFVNEFEGVSKILICCSLGLGYMLYRIERSINRNHAKTVKMFEHLHNTKIPPRDDDSIF
jgi:hypothetical protein